MRCDWEQSFTSASRRRVYFGEVLLEDVTDPINLPGQHHHEVLLEETAANGWYKFVINVASIYGSHGTTLIDSVYVARAVVPAVRIKVDTL